MCLLRQKHGNRKKKKNVEGRRVKSKCNGQNKALNVLRTNSCFLSAFF